MNKQGLRLGEMFLKEGLSDDVIKASQELDIPIVKQQKILLKQYLLDKNKKNKPL